MNQKNDIKLFLTLKSRNSAEFMEIKACQVTKLTEEMGLRYRTKKKVKELLAWLAGIGETSWDKSQSQKKHSEEIGGEHDHLVQVYMSPNPRYERNLESKMLNPFLTVYLDRFFHRTTTMMPHFQNDIAALWMLIHSAVHCRPLHYIHISPCINLRNSNALLSCHS